MSERVEGDDMSQQVSGSSAIGAECRSRVTRWQLPVSPEPCRASKADVHDDSMTVCTICGMSLALTSEEVE